MMERCDLVCPDLPKVPVLAAQGIPDDVELFTEKTERIHCVAQYEKNKRNSVHCYVTKTNWARGL